MSDVEAIKQFQQSYNDFRERDWKSYSWTK